MKQVIQLDSAGYFAGVTTADESPLEAGVYLMPSGTVDAIVPEVTEEQRAKWDGSWVLEDTPKLELKTEAEPEPVALTYAQKRAAEYPPITDYIDGVVKGDQAQIDSYIFACLAVKNKYPKQSLV